MVPSFLQNFRAARPGIAKLRHARPSDRALEKAKKRGAAKRRAACARYPGGRRNAMPCLLQVKLLADLQQLDACERYEVSVTCILKSSGPHVFVCSNIVHVE